MKTINMPPFAPTLIESTRSIGYSLETAVADIIDNSITAQASVININFFPLGDPYISILDNGHGMSSNELNIAMQYGSKNPNDLRSNDDLGRFGLGLKTASLAQCRTLSVVSIKNGIVSGRRWSIDYVIKTGEWSLIILDHEDMMQLPQYNELINNKQGTIVIWQDLDRIIQGNIDFESLLGIKMDFVREHISLVFHRFLSGEQGVKKLSISINNNPIIPTDPFMSKKSQQLMDDEQIIIRGQSITVKPYILPHISKLNEDEKRDLGGKDGLRRKQGFYVYRNKRLLIWGTWFKLMRQGDLSKLARVQVDIPNSLDDLWTLDIKKSTAIPPEEVRKNLKKMVEKISEGSKRTWTFRGKKEIDNSEIKIWNRLKTRNGGILYAINKEHPIIHNLCTFNPETRKSIEQLILLIEGNLPLNSLYIDLTNDEKFENETIVTKEKTLELLDGLLSIYPDEASKKVILDSIIFSEPFLEYSEFIMEKYLGGCINE